MKRKERSSPEQEEQAVSTLGGIHYSNNNSNEATKKARKMSLMEVETKKSDKYDRQLRLWGENGQRELENANICLLNVTATGTEILKCLVLPGVGKFAIVDNRLTCEEDLGTNFFLDSDSIGKSISLSACRLLQELNEDTIGHYYQEDPIKLLERDPEFFKSFSVVIATKMNEHDILKFDQYLWRHNIPLIVCDNFGFIGYLRIVLKEHPIIEVHPDNALEDLRLDDPFDELKTYMECIDLDNMNKMEHSHTPYLVLLYKFLQKWKKETDLSWPSNYKQKCQIKDLLKAGILRDENGINIVEENFEEALQNVNNAFVTSKISSDHEKMFSDPLVSNPLHSIHNSEFWILVCALKEFVSENGKLPLRGTLPDMFSDSRRYIELQTLFKNQAEKDIEYIFNYVQKALMELQLPASYVTRDQVKLFCKNAAFLKLLRGISLYEEYSSKDIKKVLENLEDTDFGIYLTVRAISRALNKSNILEKETMFKVAHEILQDMQMDKEDISLGYLGEILRVNGNEFHTIAAIMGGIAAQEVIKIVSKQYVPVDNIYIFDSIKNTSTSFKL